MQAPAATRSATPPAAPALPADLSELSVPGCGADCPSFILIPNLGRVTLGKGNEAITADIRHRFAMGKTEVTVRQWKAFWNASDRNYQPKLGRDTDCQWQDHAKSEDLPVVCVNVADAEAYSRWLARRKIGKLGMAVESVGLPSELEWELAARGGRLSQDYLWDNFDDACRYAQISGCAASLKPVGGGLANGYGLYDMIGNAWEWSASPWRDGRAEIPVSGRDAAEASLSRVLRGGSYKYLNTGWLRLSGRYDFRSGGRFSYIGFRLVVRMEL